MTNKLTKSLIYEINEESSKLIEELIEDNWEFYLSFGFPGFDLIHQWNECKDLRYWNAGFSKRINRKWIHTHPTLEFCHDINQVIKEAYNFVKTDKFLEI